MSYKLIVGLGNPGKKFEKTRHNVGFMAIDFLRKTLDAPKFKFDKKFNAEVSEIKIKQEKIILAKPQTFMNNSGEAVSAILSFYKILPEKLTVIHDDLDLDLEVLRESFGRGSAGHNGIESIMENLKTKKFNRLRIGIGRPLNLPPESYVLQNFPPDDLKEIKKIIKGIKPFRGSSTQK
ncbi:aminoacyl-tRNA hydrolase [Patescibacteria group bacterium]